MNPRRRSKMKTQKHCEALLAEHFSNAPRGTRRSREEAQVLIQSIVASQGNGRFMLSIGRRAFGSGAVLR